MVAFSQSLCLVAEDDVGTTFNSVCEDL